MIEATNSEVTGRTANGFRVAVSTANIYLSNDDRGGHDDGYAAAADDDDDP